MKIKKSIIPVGKTTYTVIQFNYVPYKYKDISTIRNQFIEVLRRQEGILNYIDCLIEEINSTKDIVEARNAVYQYLPKFKEQFKVIEDKSSETIDINCEGKSIVYLSKKESRLENDNLSINVLKSINRFYILSAKEKEFEFNVNGKVYKSSDIKDELIPSEVSNLLYYLAYNAYCKGNSAEALEILSLSLKDRYLSKQVLNSFTPKERESCKKLLLKSVRNRKIELEPKVWTKARLVEGIIEKGEILESGPCFMDLLEVFEKNEDMFIPIPSEKYKRIGKKVVDNYNVFRPNSEEQVVTSFRNLVFSKDKMNISVRYEIQGTVTINPRQAKEVAFDTNIFNAKVFREQTIIKDGDRNIEKFRILVSEDTLKFLKSLKIKGLFTISKNKDYRLDNHTLIQINISKLPVLSRNYVLESDNLDYVLDTYYEQKVAECKQKVIRYFIKNVAQKTQCRFVTKYSKEQIKLLKEYGLDISGIYSGIDNKVVEESSNEYECRFFEFGLKYFSILPKVDNLLKKMQSTNKKLNKPETIMKEYIEYLRKNKIDTSFEKLEKLLEEQKAIIRKNTRILAEIKLAKVLTGVWWEGLKLDANDRYIYEKEDKTLVIKMFKRNVNKQVQ